MLSYNKASQELQSSENSLKEEQFLVDSYSNFN